MSDLREFPIDQPSVVEEPAPPAELVEREPDHKYAVVYKRFLQSQNQLGLVGTILKADFYEIVDGCLVFQNFDKGRVLSIPGGSWLHVDLVDGVEEDTSPLVTP